MLHILPFLAGAAIGAAGVMVFGSKKSKKRLVEGKIYVENKLQEGKEGVVAIAECVKEKINKNKKGEEGEEESKRDEQTLQ